jgi:hypothetical protein
MGRRTCFVVYSVKGSGDHLASYYLGKDGDKSGPFDAATILQKVESGALSQGDLCLQEGVSEWQPVATVLAEAGAIQDPLPVAAEPLFLHIPIDRLIWMSIVSFGLYQVYWMYRNWRYVQIRDKRPLRPSWRGVFGVFYCHSLLNRIHRDQPSRAVLTPAFHPFVLATGWVALTLVCNVLYRAGGGYMLIAAMIPTYLFLVPVQSFVNSVAERTSAYPDYYPWSAGHIVCLLFGMVVWTLFLFEWVLPRL